MYPASVVDCCSRMLVRFAIAGHSDHGSPCAASQFQTSCRNFIVPWSMAAVGTSADNSLAESFNASGNESFLTVANQLVCRQDVFARL